MNKIKRVSLMFRLLFQSVFVVLPLLVLVAWIMAPETLSFLKGTINFELSPLHEYPVLHPMSLLNKLLGFGVSMIPVGIHMITLYFLIKLFRLYEQGKIFSLHNVCYIRNIGYTLLVGQLLHPFYEALMGLVLTWNNPPHQGLRFISVSFDRTNVSVILIALLVILISWIMAEGYKLQEEQQLTI